ncbi:hypothetical protein GCM10028810_52710 [Spirosoma litoris]
MLFAFINGFKYTNQSKMYKKEFSKNDKPFSVSFESYYPAETRLIIGPITVGTKD